MITNDYGYDGKYDDSAELRKVYHKYGKVLDSYSKHFEQIYDGNFFAFTEPDFETDFLTMLTATDTFEISITEEMAVKKYHKEYSALMGLMINPLLSNALKECLLEDLLLHNADINAKNRYGETALFMVIQRRLPIFRELLAQGADPNISNIYGITPLMIACYNDWLYEAEYLIRAGADPFIEENFWHLSAAQIATFHLSEDLVKLIAKYFPDRVLE